MEKKIIDSKTKAVKKIINGRTVYVTPDGKEYSVNPIHMEKIATYLGAIYRQSRIRMDLCGEEGLYDSASVIHHDDCSFVARMDALLLGCAGDSRQILRHQYFEDHEKDWYKTFYTKSAFRRRLKKALLEFFQVMNYGK